MDFDAQLARALDQIRMLHGDIAYLTSVVARLDAEVAELRRLLGA